jgi:hypothetical protein
MKKSFLRLLPFLVALIFLLEETMGSAQNEKDLKQISSACMNLYKETASISSTLDEKGDKKFLEKGIAIFIVLRNLTKDMSEYFQFLYFAIDKLRDKLVEFEKALESQKKVKGNDTTKADDKVRMLERDIKELYEFFVGNALYSLVAVIKADTSIFLQVASSLEFSSTELTLMKKKFSSVKGKSDAVLSAIKNFPSVFSYIRNISELKIDQHLIEETKNSIELFVDILKMINNYYDQEKLSESTTNDFLKRCSLASGSNNRDNRDNHSNGNGNYNNNYNSRNDNYNDRGNNYNDRGNNYNDRGNNYNDRGGNNSGYNDSRNSYNR